MDTDIIKKQLEILKKPVCSLDWASEKYGIDFRAEKQLTGRFRAWALRFKNKKDVMDSTQIDRFDFELFLLHAKLIPLKDASIQLGMSEGSFKEVINKMQIEGELPYQVDIDSSKVIESSLVENFLQLFPRLDSLVLTDHFQLCKALHEAIEKEFKIKIEPVFCKTSELIDTSPAYAYEFDALTSEPMSIKYQLWLDLGKPMILKPDACSMLTYVRYKDELENKLLGNYDDRIEPVEEKIKSKLSDQIKV